VLCATPSPRRRYVCVCVCLCLYMSVCVYLHVYTQVLHTEIHALQMELDNCQQDLELARQRDSSRQVSKET
jgi:hypothetical protein